MLQTSTVKDRKALLPTNVASVSAIRCIATPYEIEMWHLILRNPSVELFTLYPDGYQITISTL